MKPTPKISGTEWEIMKVVWAGAPCAAGEVISRLEAEGRSWHPKTVKTFLTRLVSKGVLGFQKEGRAYLYLPLVKREDCVAAESESFLTRVFGGSLKPMLAHFVDNKKLSRTEILELRKLLDEEEP